MENKKKKCNFFMELSEKTSNFEGPLVAVRGLDLSEPSPLSLCVCVCVCEGGWMG